MKCKVKKNDYCIFRTIRRTPQIWGDGGASYSPNVAYTVRRAGTVEPGRHCRKSYGLVRLIVQNMWCFIIGISN